MEQERQVESLQVLEQGLSSLANQGLNFEGISMQLYHPAVSAMTGEWRSAGHDPWP